MLLVCDFVCSGISHDLAPLYQLSAADMACIALFLFACAGFEVWPWEVSQCCRHHFAGAWCTSVLLPLRMLVIGCCGTLA